MMAVSRSLLFDGLRPIRSHVSHQSTNNQQKDIMKALNNTFKSLLITAIAVVAISAQAANISDKDKQFLAGYEKIHAALVADDLGAAKTAAKELGGEGNNIAEASSLKDARAGFEKLGGHAKTLVAGQSSYHVYHCPMLNKDWVQTSTTVANPYGGKGMVSCGETEK
jgi:hypothetical protein